MNKKYNLKLDLQFRCNNSTMKFDEFDNNTSDFFIRVTRAGELIDISKAIVTLVVIKPDNSVDAQFVDIDSNRAYCDLKPTMKNLVGKYEAIASITVDGETVNTGIDNPIIYEVTENKFLRQLNQKVVTEERFTLLTDMINRLSTIEISEEQRVINEAERILSEENRKIEEAKRVEAELIRQHEEADRAKYDATRESNENTRKQNESIRLANETNRIDEESKRVEEEANRVEAEQLRKDNYNFMTEDEERRRSEANAHREAEVLRVQAENTRVNEEAKRRTTEQARILAENTRVSNENTRKANETARQTNETKRVEAETQRQNRYNSFIADAEANASNFENYTNTAKAKEEERKSNELDRKSQEVRRISNEVERISNENTRKANENAREKNETSRQYVFENKVNEVDKKIIEINATKDNFVSSINTKVDTKISELNTTKDNFVSSISTKVDNKISELDSAKSDMTNTVSNKVNEVENRFNALTSKQQQDAEVIDARDGEISLKARLDRDIEKAKQVYVNVEGSHISTDSSVGYLKDVEILGNTIQNASNLADIRSVGDKVEGQELYEIPVLSRGKNLFNGKWKRGYALNLEPSSPLYGKTQVGENYSTTQDFIKVIPNETYYFTDTTAQRWVVFYDKEKKTISHDQRWGNCVTPNNTAYIKFYDHNARVDAFPNYSVSTIDNVYEPYQEDKLTILSPVKIEKVGDVADRIIEKDGVWGVEKNVITTVLDDTKVWKIESPSSTMFGAKTSLSPHVISIQHNEIKHLSYPLATKKHVQWNSLEIEGTHIHPSDNYVFVNVLSNKLETVNIDGFKKWIKNNPVVIKYPTTQPQFIPLPHSQQVKLRTFAGKTNISFLTEIEGTIKAQVPKSLGATVNTHTEQINNLNKELDRVKKLEESTVSTVTTESDFTTVEATSNGYFEDVKLEGKTLVNLFDKNKPWTQGKHDGVEGKNLYMQYEVNKSSNNTYHIIAPIGDKTSNWDDARVMIYAYNIVTNTTSKLILDKALNSNDSINRVITLTNDEVLLFNCWDISEDKFNKNYPTMMILEGDHTQNPPSYFEGLKSVGQGVDEVSVESVNENLFDGNVSLGYLNNSGLISPHQTWVVSDFIDIQGVPQLNFESTVFSGLKSIGMYDSNKKLVNYTFNVQTTVEIGKTVKYVRISMCKKPEVAPTQYELENPGITMYINLKTDKKHQSDKKRLLYYNTETQAWEKPILREGDSIEKHANGKYYYHQRSGEEDYTRGDESVSNYITDMTTTVKPLAQEKVYECTNIDLITYANETNYVVESGVLSPRTTLKVHSNISNVVSLLQKKVSLLEGNVTSYMITQNRLMLASRYNADTVSFKVDVASFSDTFEYDNDLYELILNNILVGKDNYNREYIENLTRFYWMDFVISDEMYSTLFEIIEEQHNPKIEEETPLI